MMILGWYFVVVFLTNGAYTPATFGPYTGFYGKAMCEMLNQSVYIRNPWFTANEITYVGPCFSMPLDAE